MQFIIDQHLFDKFTILWFLSFVFFNWIATLKAKTTYCEKASHSIGNLRIFNHEFTSLAIIRLSSYTAWFVKRRGLELRTSGPRYSSTVQLLLTQCLTQTIHYQKVANFLILIILLMFRFHIIRCFRVSSLLFWRW